MGWLITLVLIIAVVLGIMEMYPLAWTIVAVGIAVLIYARYKKN